MNSLSHKTGAFSLAEVTLAIGVAAFCLISVFGLLPVGVASNQAAIHQTKANGLLSAVASDLRATPPTSPRGASTPSPQFAITIPANPVPAATPAPTTRYFTSEGKSSTTLNTWSIYRMTITFPSNASSRAATLVNLKVTWPPQIDPATGTPAGSLQSFVALDRN